MSPAAQELSMSQIAPILVAAVPRVVVPVGAEDADELVQDALVAAFEAVHRLEKKGQQSKPSVTHFPSRKTLIIGLAPHWLAQAPLFLILAKCRSISREYSVFFPKRPRPTQPLCGETRLSLSQQLPQLRRWRSPVSMVRAMGGLGWIWSVWTQ
jgi:hypothetical protein